MTYLLLFSFDGKVTKSDMGRDILHSLVRAVTDSPIASPFNKKLDCLTNNLLKLIL